MYLLWLLVFGSMSDEPINANPQVKDLSQLPTRQSKKGRNEQIGKEYPHISHSLKYKNLVSKFLFDDADESRESENDVDGMDVDVDDDEEPVDSQEIYDLISTISDPEHPLTLGQLSVVNLTDIAVRHPDIAQGTVGAVTVLITPTITHCSLATLIGLGIRVRLDRSVSKSYRIGIYVKKGTHQSEGQVNKQLNDKERVCAACENPQLVKVVGRMLQTCM